MERLRTRTEKVEIASYFPKTTRLMYEWQNDHQTGDNFKPKVIDLCKTIEEDLKKLFTGNNDLYSIPYKIGVIGDGSVGKSALIMALSNTQNTAATVLSQRSTFGYLQLDTFFEDQKSKKSIPISFIDIEGAIDNDPDRSLHNYIDIIMKTDCDLYLIAHDKPFSAFNQKCLNDIEQTLQRRCLLVRNKADIIFKQLYNEIIKNQYPQGNCTKQRLNRILEKVREQSSINFKEEKLQQKVFLTAAGHANDLKETKFGLFDFEKLKKQLLKSATKDSRIERICKLAILLSKTVINTAFRRGYAVSKTPYGLAAAGVSIVPGADEIAAFFGREKIRQAFGIHDQFAVTHSICNTKDSLEEYLMEHQFNIPKDALKSGYFQCLISTDENSTNARKEFEFSQSVDPKSIIDRGKITRSSLKNRWNIRIHGSKVASISMIIGSGVVQAANDVIRIAAPAAAGALRVVSIAGIVAGVILTPVFAGWAFYQAGNRMHQGGKS